MWTEPAARPDDGVCPVCHQGYRLTKRGKLVPHGPAMRCPGGGQTPTSILTVAITRLAQQGA